MAINLLGKVPKLTGSYAPAPSINPSEAAKPVAQKPASTLNSFISSGNVRAGQVVPVGVKAKSPATNVSNAPTTIPKAQAQPIAASPISTPSSTAVNPINNSTQGGTDTPSFNGLIGQLVGQQGSKNGKAAQESISGLQETAQKNQGTSGKAYSDYQTKVNEYEDLKKQEAAKLGGVASQPIPLEFQQGRTQVLQNQYAIQNDAAQQAINQAQQGIGYQLQGAGVQQAGLNQAGNLALTGQSQQIGAFGNAVNATQPQQGSIGAVTYNPTNPSQQSILGSSAPGGINGAGQLLGQFQGAQAAGAAPGQANASNIQTAGTYATNTAATGGAAAVQSYNNLNAANNQFEGQASQLLSVLSQYQLNGTLPDINKPLNSISGRLGSTGVSALNSAFAETVSAYNAILSSGGGTPTSQDQQALAALNINSTPAQIATSIQQLQQAAKIKLGAAQGLAQGYNSSLGGNQGTPSSGGVINTAYGAIDPSL